MIERKDLDFDFPEELTKITAEYAWEDNTCGYSGTYVFKLIKHQETLFLKINKPKSEFNLEKEKIILEWLKNKLPVPDVIYFDIKNDIEFLLLSTITGQNSHTMKTKEEREVSIDILAKALKEIHQIGIKDCPLDNNPDDLLEIAKKKTETWILDSNQFDERWKDKTPKELYREILKIKPEEYDLVFSHGDYCLPNILIEDKKLSGLIDWPYGGINDRYCDFAAVAWSISYNYGEEWVPLFFEKYGIKNVDWEKIKFFQMLNEFFQQ